MRSNCLLFVIALWWRGRKRRAKGRSQGGEQRYYVAWRKSDIGMFPHFLWVEHGHFISYQPVRSKKAVLFPPPLFHGFVRWGDVPNKGKSWH